MHIHPVVSDLEVVRMVKWSMLKIGNFVISPAGKELIDMKSHTTAILPLSPRVTQYTECNTI